MSESTFTPLFGQSTVLFRGIRNMWLDDGVLMAELDDGTTETIGPVSSYADAVEHGYAGPGTDFPDEESWSEHIASVTEYVSDSEAWANGTRGGVPIVDDGDPAYHNNSKYYSEQAAASAEALSGVEERILGEGGAEDRIDAIETATENERKTAECWAVGTKDGDEITDIDPTHPSKTNNSKYYSEQASTFKDIAVEKAGNASDSQIAAAASASSANTYAETSECWAVGTKAGTEITDPDSSHPSVTNNSKYYATEAESSALDAETNSLISEGYAVGKQNGTDVPSGPYYHNNAKYYAQQAALYAVNQVEIKYQVSSNYSNPENFPEADWVDAPDVSTAAGKYLWTRIKLSVNGSVSTFYSVGHIGANGTGSTTSVNGLSGAVVLTAENINESSSQGSQTIAQAIEEVDDKIDTYIAQGQQILEYDVVSQPSAGETAFPEIGQDDKVYIAKKTNTMYRWDSNVSAYVSIGSGGGGTANEMTGATSTASGTGGTVPAPPAGANVKYLRGDKTWSNPVSKDTIKTALSATQASTDRFLNENGEWVAVAINDSSLVHISTDEVIQGQKTFKKAPIIQSNTSQYKYIYFNNGVDNHGYIMCDSGTAGDLTASQMAFVVVSPRSSNNNVEKYILPVCSESLTADRVYSILTSKNAVSVAQGGTGASSAADARTNLGLGTAATSNTASSIAAGSTATTLPTSKAVADFVEGKGYLTSHQSLSSCVKTTGNQSLSGVVSITNSTASSSTKTGALKVTGGIGCQGNIYGSKVWNGVWNDYAECRTAETIEGGYCVTESSDKIMKKTWARLQPGCKLTSDTFGTCMGETDEAKTPIAVAGRVLAYPYRDISEYHLGDAVCSAPDGKIDIMTREEIREYPERIVGTVSEIPDGDVWYGGTKEEPKPVLVKGRIWIYVR